MSPRKPNRTQPCTQTQAAARLRHAREHLEITELVASEADSVALANSAASLAVLAGIAAADAACCHALGKRSRSEDHRDAVDLLKQVTPGGAKAANDLALLLGLKDESQYGFGDIAATKLRGARRRAGSLVEFAAEVLGR
jgi:hypothetical protein